MLTKYDPTTDLDTIEEIAQDHTHDDRNPDARAIVLELFTGDEPDDETPGALWLLTDADADAYEQDADAYIDAHAAAGEVFDTTCTQTHADLP